MRDFIQIRITHYGDGHFLAQLRTGHAGDEPIVLAEIVPGALSVYCIDIPKANPMYYLEIVPDGHWSLEMIATE